jgi:hypothetical protein
VIYEPVNPQRLAQHKHYLERLLEPLYQRHTCEPGARVAGTGLLQPELERVGTYPAIIETGVLNRTGTISSGRTPNWSADFQSAFIPGGRASGESGHSLRAVLHRTRKAGCKPALRRSGELAFAGNINTPTVTPGLHFFLAKVSHDSSVCAIENEI